MVEVYVERARQLAVARDVVQDDPSLASATALLSVHTAIALNDALLQMLQGPRTVGDDHRRAVSETEAACDRLGLDRRGIRHLRLLLGRKSDVSYGREPVQPELAVALAVASQRFEEWAYAIMKRGAMRWA